ncbi:AAA family ATPase [Mycolicibacterium mengxianglii]|uniref:AAA family ATPase n=1 Tax=Mycolicibacterium mengxianglii TaxID=2736649 RepID=UPI0018EEED99|nr:AAA family ATPase [Mycolicibacterium mengxianglii]
MLIWISGAFGAGKTHTAHELQRRLPEAHVADPELLGFAMHKMLPAAARDDFQDLAQWRAGVVATLRDAERASAGPVIVPMTVVRDDYFDEIIGALRASVEVRHYALIASPETLRKRLRSRWETRSARLVGGGDETWAMRHIDHCVATLAQPRYAAHVPTDDRGLDEVVEAIAADAGLTLNRPRLSPLRAQAPRLEVAVRHIRL